MWSPGLAYVLTNSLHVDWYFANGRVATASVEVVDSSVGVPNMDDLALLLEDVTGRTQDVCSFNSRFIEMWIQYRRSYVA